MKRPSAGDLAHSVGLYKREEGNPDSPADYGNTVLDWVLQFNRRAAYIHLRGGETVLAGRLQGRHTQVVRVRSDTQTREITTDWQVRIEDGTAFNVRDVSLVEDGRQFIDLLCESGVPA